MGAEIAAAIRRIQSNLSVVRHLGSWPHHPRKRTARKTYRTWDQAKADVFDYIELYNSKRRLWSSKCSDN